MEKSYRVVKTNCNYENCEKQIDVIISSIEVLVTHQTIEILDIQKSEYEENKIVTPNKDGIFFNDYIIVQCPCKSNHSQRVYLKKE